MVSEVSGSIKDRLSSPIVGTYTTYLMILHWKVFVVLFSAGSAGDRIKGVEVILNEIFWWNVLGALAFTLVTLLGLPYLKSIYEKFLSDRESKTAMYINQNIRNVGRDNAEATGAIKNVVLCNAKVLEVQNILKSLQSTINQYERVIGTKGGSSGELKINLENNIAEIQNRVSQVKIAIDDLGRDAKSLLK